MNNLVTSAEKSQSTTTYQKAVLTDNGRENPLRLVAEVLPEPQADEVLVNVLASGVAFADILCRLGLYPGRPKLPFSPGYDLVGTVAKVGSNVSAIKAGQMAAALLPKFGANAEYVCIPAAWLVPVPNGVDPVTAVAIILNYLTAYHILQNKAKAQPGERVLVHSAAGGVGTAVLQLGQEMGLEMFGTASKSKLDLVRQLGATAIDYQHEDFAERIQQLTGDGVDIVCDPVGGATMVKSYNSLRPGGRLINYGFFSAQDDGKTAVVKSFARLFWYGLKRDGRKASFFGSTPDMVKKDPVRYRQSLAALFEMAVDGRIQPIIGATFPLSQINEAQLSLQSGNVRGKIVLVSD